MARQPVGQGQTALITGASSGIGEALAQRFARAGFNLVLVARSADKLKVLATALAAEHGIKAWVSPADLAQPGAAQKLAAAMKRARRPIDVLVNNAGVLTHGAFVDMPATRHRELIDLNVTGLTEMLAHFVPPMVARGQGRVLNVASIAAFQPVPMLATYAATKAYVLSLTESLSEELQGTGVTITTLCPGITATSMFDQAKAASAQATPANDTRACSRLSSTTSVSPPSATSSPAMRSHDARRSCSSSVAIGCTPRMVASAPGVRP